jgi:hypothetical protein
VVLKWLKRNKDLKLAFRLADENAFQELASEILRVGHSSSRISLFRIQKLMLHLVDEPVI